MVLPRFLRGAQEFALKSLTVEGIVCPASRKSKVYYQFLAVSMEEEGNYFDISGGSGQLSGG